MNIAICGSMSCAEEMLYYANRLRERGYSVFLPVGTRVYTQRARSGKDEGALRKIKLDLITT